MIKVCIITTSFPRWPKDHRGAFIWEAARAIQRQGAQVRVVAMHQPGSRRQEVLEDIEVFRPPYLWPESLEILQKEEGGLPIMWQRNPLARLALLPFLVMHSAATARYARTCDIIHANWTLSAGAAWVTSPVHKRPVIATVQGSDIFQAARIPGVRQLTTSALIHCKRVLALSSSLAEATYSLGVPRRTIEVLPNGVDTVFFKPEDTFREPLVVYTGSFIKRKGVLYLLTAFRQVLTAMNNYRLILLGDGPQREALSRLAETLGIGERVTFTGTQTPEQVRAWLRRAQLFVLPSLEEGLGVVLLEALACGLPCVGTQVGGIPDIITTEVGLLVPPADSATLAEAITTLLSNPTQWAQLSRNARQRAEQVYNWDTIAKRLIQIYEQVLSDHP